VTYSGHDDLAEQAIAALKAAGFTGDQIGVVLRERTAQGALLEETGTQAAEEAATTGRSGADSWGPGGFADRHRRLDYSGRRTGRRQRGGGDRLRGGWGTAVAGAGIDAAARGLFGAFAGLRIAESEARYFETGFRAGQVLVTVEAGARVLEAMAILDQHGADTGPATGPGAIVC
jgi:hypothetical protein